MRFVTETIAAITAALSGNSSPVTTSDVDTIDLTVAIADVTPADFTATAAGIDVTENTFTKTAHGLTTGLKITAITSDGALPTGVSGATVYYVISSDANHFKIATSQANALAGTAVDITNAGSGTDSFDVAATLAGSVKLQKNVAAIGSAADWVDISGSSTNFSAAGNLNWELHSVGFGDLRYVVTVTSGAVTASGSFSGKGDGTIHSLQTIYEHNGAALTTNDDKDGLDITHGEADVNAISIDVSEVTGVAYGIGIIGGASNDSQSQLVWIDSVGEGEALSVAHSGAAGSPVKMFTTNASNADPVLKLRNQGTGAPLRLEGKTSGYVEVAPPDAPTSYKLTLPTDDGNSGQSLTTNGSGVTSWSTVSGSQYTANVPATDADSCTPGQYAADASYFYICYANDGWRRVATEAFGL